MRCTRVLRIPGDALGSISVHTITSLVIRRGNRFGSRWTTGIRNAPALDARVYLRRDVRMPAGTEWLEVLRGGAGEGREGQGQGSGVGEGGVWRTDILL